MKKFFTLLLRHWIKTPVKIMLTITAVALGTGILVISFSAGSILETEIVSKLNENGIILYGANGEWASDGSLEMKRPSQWDVKIFDKLVYSNI